VPGFGVRVTDRGSMSFILYARVPPSRAPARRVLGDATRMGLAAARQKARKWLDLIEQDKDPKEVARQAELAAQRAQRTTFGAVAEDFIRDKLPSERKGGARRRLLKNCTKSPGIPCTSGMCTERAVWHASRCPIGCFRISTV
jgi:hypothetical protein